MNNQCLWEVDIEFKILMQKVKSLLKQTTPLQICSPPFLNSPEIKSMYIGLYKTPNKALSCLVLSINVKAAGGRGGRQGMGWEFDCLCWPWGRAFDPWCCSPGEWDIWIFLRPTWGWIWLPTRTKETETEHMFPHFHASRTRLTV